MKPQGNFGVVMDIRLKELGMKPQLLAEKINHSYEHLRKILINEASPSDLLLKEICRVIKLNFEEMSVLVMKDRVIRDHGEEIYSLFKMDARMAKLDPLVRHLSGGDFAALLNVAESLVKGKKQANT